MIRYVWHRLLMVIPVLIGICFVVFFITDLAPGDAADILATEGMMVEDIEEMREAMGLNRPVVVRFVEYMGNMLKGDLGQSYYTKKDVWVLIIDVLPNTVVLAFWTTVFATVISIPLGIYSANRRGQWQDSVAMVFALFGLSMPGFFVGLMLIIIFSLNLGWLPSNGCKGWEYYILPSVSAGASMLATMTRTTRSAMLDVLTMDYLDLARAKGVSEKVVINKHALKNALIPIITVVGTQFAVSLGGTTIIEKLFTWPGLGALTVDAVSGRDIPLVCGGNIVGTGMVTLGLLLIDILYAFVDPRIKAKYSGGGKKKKKKTAVKKEVMA